MAASNAYSILSLEPAYTTLSDTIAADLMTSPVWNVQIGPPFAESSAYTVLSSAPTYTVPSAMVGAFMAQPVTLNCQRVASMGSAGCSPEDGPGIPVGGSAPVGIGAHFSMPAANSMTAWLGIWPDVGSWSAAAMIPPMSVSASRVSMHSFASGGISSPPASPRSTSFTMSAKSIAPERAIAVSGVRQANTAGAH